MESTTIMDTVTSLIPTVKNAFSLFLEPPINIFVALAIIGVVIAVVRKLIKFKRG